MPAQNTRLPLIGKIRVGEKRINSAGKEYPCSLDYFIATGAYAAKFDAVYVKPERIPIVFISDDDFQSCYEEWDARDKEGRRAGYGDGETYWLWEYGKDRYNETKDKQEVAAFSKKHAIKWRQVLTINFIIPAIKGVFGVWQLQTGGDKSSINAIRNTYDEIKELAGTVINIPFDLCVKRVTSNKPEAKSVYPVISLVPNISAENMETLRAFFEAGLDIKKQGILTEQKLQALGEHTPAQEITMAEIGTNLDGQRNPVASDGSDYCTKCGSPEVDGVCTECSKPSGQLKAGATALDAAVVTQTFKETGKLNTGEVTHAQAVETQIKRCQTVRDLQDLFSNEPSLFMEDESTPLNVLFTERMNEVKGQGNG